MRRSLLLLLLSAALGGCAVAPSDYRAVGTSRCESFFIYVLCIADYDSNGSVDYMYFDDTKEIFMFDPVMTDALRGILPFHPCAIPLSPPVQDRSSQLLYDEGLSLTQRLGLKGRLVSDYRKAQPAVDACYAELKEKEGIDAPEEEPFLIEDEWEKGPG